MLNIFYPGLYDNFDTTLFSYVSLRIPPDMLHHIYGEYQIKFYNILLINLQIHRMLNNEQKLCYCYPVPLAIELFESYQ